MSPGNGYEREFLLKVRNGDIKQHLLLLDDSLPEHIAIHNRVYLKQIALKLSAKERQLLILLSREYEQSEIGDFFRISQQAVSKRLRNMEKVLYFLLEYS